MDNFESAYSDLGKALEIKDDPLIREEYTNLGIKIQNETKAQKKYIGNITKRIMNPRPGDNDIIHESVTPASLEKEKVRLTDRDSSIPFVPKELQKKSLLEDELPGQKELNKLNLYL
jgi:hypothetical protein